MKSPQSKKNRHLLLQEIGNLRRELSLTKSRSVEQRATLVRDTLETLTLMSQYLADGAPGPHTPGTPEYGTDRSNFLAKSYQEEFDLQRRNLRVEILSRAAVQVFPEGFAARHWMDQTPVGRWSSPYFAAVDSEDGMRAALEVLETHWQFRQ